MPEFPIKIMILGKLVLLHFIMEALGIFISVRFYCYLRKQQQQLPIIINLIILIGAIFGAYFGSHIFRSFRKSSSMEKFSEAY